eukprot:sb/3463787/
MPRTSRLQHRAAGELGRFEFYFIGNESCSKVILRPHVRWEWGPLGDLHDSLACTNGVVIYSRHNLVRPLNQERFHSLSRIVINNGVWVTTVKGSAFNTSTSVNAGKLEIIVFSDGHMNTGHVQVPSPRHYMKGITEMVLFNGEELKGWSVTLLSLTDMSCYKPARGKQEPSSFLPGSIYTVYNALPQSNRCPSRLNAKAARQIQLVLHGYLKIPETGTFLPKCLGLSCSKVILRPHVRWEWGPLGDLHDSLACVSVESGIQEKKTLIYVHHYDAADGDTSPLRLAQPTSRRRDKGGVVGISAQGEREKEERESLTNGVVIYSRHLDQSGELVLSKVRDRAYVINNGVWVTTVKGSAFNTSTSVNAGKLEIIVFSDGHMNTGHVQVPSPRHYMKGITEMVLFNGEELKGWSVTLLSLTDMSCYKPARGKQEPSSFLPGSIYTGELLSCIEGTDTFLNTQGWGKGVAYFGDINLGRYWPLAGPQLTLYVPSPFCKAGNLRVSLLELERPSSTVEFLDTPNLRGPVDPSQL